MSSENRKMLDGVRPAVKIGRRRRCQIRRHFRLKDLATGTDAANDCFMSAKSSINCEIDLPLRKKIVRRQNAKEKPFKNPSVQVQSRFIQQPKKF